MSKPSRTPNRSAMVQPPVVVPPQISASAPIAAQPPPAPADAAPAIPEPVYSWPSKVRCPHCGRMDTKVNGIIGAIRYLQCRHASCKRTFKILGTLI